MRRRAFLALGSGAVVAQACLTSAWAQDALSSRLLHSQETREPVLVRAGLTRRPDGTNGPMTIPQQTVVRSFDSQGRLAAFVVPVGEHHPYRGAPLHLHHEQDEWIHVTVGEFVAEVGGRRMRLKPGDSLLMPMKIPHRWSVAAQAHCGAIHLYTPAGLMDVSWDPHPEEKEPQTREERKDWFEKYRLTLLGDPLTKEEIDATV
jgi:quercetin dioxygenase-like cupin family protein